MVPRQQLDSQQATVGQFDGAIQSDQAQINNAKLNLTYSKITSPISGRVGLRLVDPGNIVHAADTTGMLVITQVQPIAVIFTLPEDNLPQVIAEMRNRQLTVEAYGRDNKTKIADGKLLTIDNQIDQTTGTVRLKSVFHNQRHFSVAQSICEHPAVSHLGKKRDRHSLRGDSEGRAGRLRLCREIGLHRGCSSHSGRLYRRQYRRDHEGLGSGEQVVIDGQDKLQAGAKVNANPVSPARTQQSPLPAGGKNQ